MNRAGILQVSARILRVVIERLAVLHERVRAQTNAQGLLLEVHAGVPGGARQPAPVGIVAEDGRLRQRRRNDGPGDEPGVVQGIRTVDVALDEARGALAVPRDGLGDADAHGRQSRLQLLRLGGPGGDWIAARRARR